LTLSYQNPGEAISPSGAGIRIVVVVVDEVVVVVVLGTVVVVDLVVVVEIEVVLVLDELVVVVARVLDVLEVDVVDVEIIDVEEVEVVVVEVVVFTIVPPPEEAQPWDPNIPINTMNKKINQLISFLIVMIAIWLLFSALFIPIRKSHCACETTKRKGPSKPDRRFNSPENSQRWKGHDQKCDQPSPGNNIIAVNEFRVIPSFFRCCFHGIL